MGQTVSYTYKDKLYYGEILDFKVVRDKIFAIVGFDNGVIMKVEINDSCDLRLEDG